MFFWRQVLFVQSQLYSMSHHLSFPLLNHKQVSVSDPVQDRTSEWFKRVLELGDKDIFKNYKKKFYTLSFGEIPSAPRGAGCQPPAGPCPNSKYRTIDGSCNNLRYTNWGIPNSKYARLLPPKYSDGKFKYSWHTATIRVHVHFL